MSDNCAMATLGEAWTRAASALPAGWWLAGLRCTSTGLDPSQRGDDWIAEACGPNGECLLIESSEPAVALATLTERLLARGLASVDDLDT